MFHHISLLWMIETKEKYTFYVEEHYIEWCTVVPWFKQLFFQNLHVPTFEEFFVTASQDRYDLMCRMHAYNKKMISKLVHQTLAVEEP